MLAGKPVTCHNSGLRWRSFSAQLHISPHAPDWLTPRQSPENLGAFGRKESPAQAMLSGCAGFV